MDPRTEELQGLLLHEQPSHADVIVWLQGDRFDRGPRALHLYKLNFAPRIVITGNNLLLKKGFRPSESNISLSVMESLLKEKGVPPKDIIVEQRSMNTREQAVNVLALAKNNNWKIILLVGSTYHQIRPFLTFLKRAKEIGWHGVIINQPALLNNDDIPGGREKTVQEYLIEEIAKIKRYSKHVVDIDEGLRIFRENNARIPTNEP